MSFRLCAALFLLLTLASGIVKFSVDATRTGLLIDVTFIVAALGLLICGIGHLGRRLANLAGTDDPHRSRRP